jgi:hypothetical protein
VRGTSGLLRLRLKQMVAGRLPWLVPIHVALVAAVILLAPAPTAEGRVRLALGAAIGLSGLVAAVAAVAFGARLLPDDRESRRLRRLMALPASRTALAVSSVVASMVAALLLALTLAAAALPVLLATGGADARRLVLRSTTRLPSDAIHALGERREVNGRVWIFGRNPGIRFEVAVPASARSAGDLHGRIEVARRVDVRGRMRDRIRVGVRVEGAEEVVVPLGPDQPIPVRVSGEAAADGRVSVTLRRLDADYVLGVRPDSLVLDGPSRSFLPEYALAALGAGIVAALLAAAGTAVSTVATAGVGMASALLLGLLGSVRQVLATAAEALRTGAGHHHGPAPEPTWFDRFSAAVADAVATMAPDLETIGLGAALRAGDTADPAAIGAAMLAAGP